MGDHRPLTFFRKRLTEGTFYCYSKFFILLFLEDVFKIHHFLK